MTDKDTVKKLLDKIKQSYVEKKKRGYDVVDISGYYAYAVFSFNEQGELVDLEVAH